MKNRLTQVRVRLQQRNEAGASTLVTILTVGLVVLVIVGALASAASFGAKISKQQVQQMSAKLETQSLANRFVSTLLTGTDLTTRTNLPATGSYKLYYSEAVEQPSTISDPNVYELTTTEVPEAAHWILVEVSPESREESASTLIYRYQSQSDSLPTAVSWQGAVEFNDSRLQPAAGVQGSSTITVEGSANATSESFVANDSRLTADVYTNYSGEANDVFLNTTVRGDLAANSSINLLEEARVLGDVYSKELIAAKPTQSSGVQKQYESQLPTSSLLSPSSLKTVANEVTLTDGDCATAGRLKQKLESFTEPTVIRGVETCAPESWDALIEPQTELTLTAAAPLTVSKLQVKGAGTLNFISEDSLELDSVEYKDGAVGVYAANKDLTVKNSQLAGAITNYRETGSGKLSLTASELSYYPLTSPFADICSGVSCSLDELSAHLVRVN